MKRDIDRRQALAYLGALGSAALVGCGDAGATADLKSGADAAACDAIPDETSGPYPDTRGMVSNPAYYRSDITEGKAGTPLTLTLTVVDVGAGCAPIAGANLEVWHCDADGVYSEYANATNAGSTSTTYLRGVQTTDQNGQVTFKTIYPGWYNPRATHIHIQVYDGANLQKTTQIGFPDDINNAVYDQSTLYSKGENATTNDADQVFGNAAGGSGGDGGGHEFQIAEITGNNLSGYSARIQVGLTSYV